jgi:prepilin-type processing-associated H-X9-DG protein
VIVTAEHLAGTSRWTPRLRPADISDGLSRTVLTAELHVPRDRLGYPPENGPAYDATDFFASSRVGGIGVPLADGPDDDVVGMGLFAFGSWHPGVCHMAFGDGRVEAVSTAIASDVLAAICNRSDASQ